MKGRTVLLRSSDGESFEVDEAVALQSQIIKYMIEDDCVDNGIPLPNVTSGILASVPLPDDLRMELRLTKATNNKINHSNPAAVEDLKNWDAEFLKVNQATLFDLILLDRECRLIKAANNKINNSNSAAEEALKNWDAEFVKVDGETLFDLIMVANYLEINGLLDLTYQAIADIIKEGTPEEIRKMLNLETDFTSEEEEEVCRENLLAFN